MNKSPFTSILGAISTIASIIGIVFYFINPTITIVCAVISILNSILQVTFGDQNNIITEIVTIIIAAIIALIIQKPIFPIICFAICLGDALMSVVGWISMILFYKSGQNSTKQTDERYKESFENPSDFINISFMTDEEKSDFRNLSKTITTTENTYQKALDDLGDLTENDIELLYKSNTISEEQYNSTKSAYESLLFMKETYPDLIAEIKLKRRNMYSDSLLSAYESGKIDKDLYLHLLENINYF